MSQIALPLETAAPSGGGGYLVTAANADVHKQLSDWQNWPNLMAILVGPTSSGKSVMAKRFEDDSDGYCLDDTDSYDDEEVFHLWNRAKGNNKPLLLTGSKPVSRWGVELPDLKSRIASALVIEIPLPDEAMIEGLLQKYYVRRGLTITEDALSYLGKRIERSYANTLRLAKEMDELAIERKKPITLAIARAALARQQSMDASGGNK